MLPQLPFFLSIAFSFIAWGILAARYIWPALRVLPRADALRPLLILHSFRFIGWAFMVPGPNSDLSTWLRLHWLRLLRQTGKAARGNGGAAR